VLSGETGAAPRSGGVPGADGLTAPRPLLPRASSDRDQTKPPRARGLHTSVHADTSAPTCGDPCGVSRGRRSRWVSCAPGGTRTPNLLIRSQNRGGSTYPCSGRVAASCTHCAHVRVATREIGLPLGGGRATGRRAPRKQTRPADLSGSRADLPLIRNTAIMRLAARRDSAHERAMVYASSREVGDQGAGGARS
jgi:hypothetical protein